MLAKRSRNLIQVLLVALLSAALAPQRLWSSPFLYRVSKTYTTLEFTVTKWMVFKEQGLFQDFQGQLSYDPQHPEKSRVDVTVQAASIDTREPNRDKVLRSDDFFDVEKYPTLSFQSTTAVAKTPDALDVTGDLTIHGVTHRITIPVKILGVQEMPNVGSFVGFETNFTIDRRDYGVLGSRWSGGKLAIDNTVYIHLILGGVKG
ncbi:MAG TPA: YceI family protein [Candidatus Acidoferrales bacterium]|nr:YceI family protein [Candidatus Acidoferrales bacterium]